MPRTVVFSILLFSLCVQLYAQKRPASAAKKPAPAPRLNDAKGYAIIELTATGSERFDAEEILKASGLEKNKELQSPLDDVKAAAQKLINSGVFTEVNFKHSAAPGGMKVEFTVADKDDNQFIKCDFANIVWFGDQDLLIELHDRLPLFNGTVPREGTLADDVAKTLQDLLKEKGVNANVANENQDTTNSDAATEAMAYRVVDVDIKIARLELTGASPQMLSEANAVGDKIVGLAYNRSTVRRFIDGDLRNAYKKKGYLRVTFAAPDVKVLDSAGKVTNITISIPVTEGAMYKAGAVRWLGNRAMTPESLNSYLHLSPGSPADGAQLAHDIVNIRYHYASLGYLHMLLSPRPVYDDQSGVVNYQMVIVEGDRFSMGKFDVEGLQPANAEKIRLAWKLREGDPFDAAYLESFGKRLRFGSETYFFYDELEGERPHSIDVTMVFCNTKEACKPKAENKLYTPPPGADESKPQ